MKRMFSLPMQMATMLLALFAFALPANAAAPGTPRSFTATVDGNPQYIQLTWTANEELDKADGYKIYLAYGQTDNLEKFKFYANHSESTKYAIKNLEAGTYSVYIKAYNTDGESDRTDFRFVTIQKANNGVVLKFKTEPSRTATSGKEYVYEPKAISSDGSMVLYRLDGDIPDGMTFDTKTGVVRWTPTKDGSYKYIVVAYLEGNPDVKIIQIVEVKVGKVQEDAVRFLSEPNRVANSGKPYSYQPKVITSDPNVKVLFKLDIAPEGMTIDENTGLISWTPTRDGEFKVSISAYVPGTTLKATQLFVIVVGQSNGGGEKDAIRFITKPLENGCIGKEYVYDAEAVSVSTSILSLSYKLTASPEGMTIDEKTGLIRWTPSKEGEYKVIIVASLMNTLLSATQSFTLRVSTKCEVPVQVCAKIFGKITDDNGVPGVAINGGTVRAVRLEKDNKGEASFYGKISNGQYLIMVTEGTYALIVSGEGIVEEWYMDATSIDKATPISVKCDEKSEANFSVATREKPKNILVEGTVTNANGEGVFAMVEFIVKDKNGADAKEMMGRFVTKTGEKGNYRIEIPQNLTVIAHAIPVSDKYLDQYFEKVNNPEEATRLTLTDNMAVNFVLEERASYNNGFAGRVRDSASVGINARVVAYRIIPSSNNKEPIRYEARTVETNANGEFSIANLIPAEYFLFAIPREKQGFIPGYYKSGDFAAMKWQDATRITVGEVMIDQIFEIILRPSYGKRGGAKLGGKVTHKGGIPKAGAGILAESPLSGAYLLAYDETGNVSDYIFSDDQGTFNFEELTAGNFILTTDKPGFVSMQTTAMVDYAQRSSVQVNIVVDAQSVSGVEEDVVVASTGGLVFPNPASNRVNVRLNSSESALTVRIINTLGSEVLRFNAETSGSDSIVSFDTANLPNGMYSINIQGGERPISLPLTIIR